MREHSSETLSFKKLNEEDLIIKNKLTLESSLSEKKGLKKCKTNNYDRDFLNKKNSKSFYLRVQVKKTLTTSNLLKMYSM